jgi:DNA-binding NtrC family response regulator
VFVASRVDTRERLEGTLREVEARVLQRALRRSGGNKSEAARALGLKRTTFLDKLRRHGLDETAAPDVGGPALG